MGKNDKPTLNCEHPFRILRYSMRNLWLLIFPLLRGFSVYSFSTEGAYLWLKGAWADILVVVLIIMFGAVRWRMTGFIVNNESITYREGVIFRLTTEIPFENISVTTIEKPFYLIPLKGVRVSFDTRAGFFRTTDLKLLLTNKDAQSLLDRIPNINVKKSFDEKHSSLSVFLFSIFHSSGLSGAMYIGILFVKGGDIAQGLILEYLSKLTETTEKLTSGFILKIPGAALAVGTFFIGAWFLSFTINLFRYINFGLMSDDNVLDIRCGFLNRRHYRINYDQINFTDSRCDLIMKKFEAEAVTVSCAGYGTSSRHLPVALPVNSENKPVKLFERLGTEEKMKKVYKPRSSGWWNYVWLPFLSTVFLFPLSDKAAQLFPHFSDLIRFTGIMLIIPSVWCVIVKTVAFKCSRVFLSEDRIRIVCSKWTTFHTVNAKRQNIVKMDIMQTIIQKFSRKCRITFWLCGEGITKYTLRAMDIADAKKIANELGFGIGIDESTSLE